MSLTHAPWDRLTNRERAVRWLTFTDEQKKLRWVLHLLDLSIGELADDLGIPELRARQALAGNRRHRLTRAAAKKVNQMLRKVRPRCTR
jgi:hypothetical protein